MSKTRIATSGSRAIASLPLCSIKKLLGYRQVVVVAPHPDDETLGCGGAIALLHQHNIPVQVLVISDGTKSHPHSKSHPAIQLKKLREAETRQAVATLGLSADSVTFFEWPDAGVPERDQVLFGHAVEQCNHYLCMHSPDLVLVPWRHDQHRDHRATWHIVHQALKAWPMPPHWFAYPIWGSVVAGLPAVPPGETGWRLDISAVQLLKRQAVMAHVSQTTDLINDDPQGFQLTAEMLNNLIQPWEIYLEVA